MTSYTVFYREVGATEFLSLSVSETSATITAQKGKSYEFKVKAANEDGDSEFTQLISIKAATKAYQPQAPSITFEMPNYVIAWL